MNQLQRQPAEAKPNNFAESPGTDYQQSGVLVGSGAGERSHGVLALDDACSDGHAGVTQRSDPLAADCRLHRRPMAGHVTIAQAPSRMRLEGTDSDDLGTASAGDVSTPVHCGSAARRSVHAHDYSVDGCGRARDGDYGEWSPSVMSEMVRHAADVKAGEVTGAASPNDDQVDALCLSGGEQTVRSADEL